MDTTVYFLLVSANENFVYLARMGVFKLSLTSQLKHLKVIKKQKEDVVKKAKHKNAQ